MRRAPTHRRMLCSLAAVWARTTPASVLRSAMPMAARPSAAACRTISCACEAPRRNEKLVAATSSAKAVMDASAIAACATRVVLRWIPDIRWRELRDDKVWSSPYPVHEPLRDGVAAAAVQAGAVEPEA